MVKPRAYGLILVAQEAVAKALAGMGWEAAVVREQAVEEVMALVKEEVV